MLSEYKYTFNFNPLIRYNISLLGGVAGINDLKREVPIIVSLTSSEENFDKIGLTLYSLLNQNIKPDRLILWISDEYDISDLPYDVTRFVKNGLEINKVKDLGSYNKTIYPLKQYLKAVLVTANELVYYPRNWLQKLYYSYIASSQEIQIHVAHKVKFDNDKILPYAGWKKHIVEEVSEYDNFLSDVGGILYPPSCFSKEVFREDIFKKNNITNSDIWFWFMAVLAGRKIRVVKNHIKTISSTNIINQLMFNQKEQNSKNDEQIMTLMDYYGQNILTKLSF